MPIYSVQGPDGRIYDIEGPAGASDAQIIGALEEHLASMPAPKKGLGAALGKGVESTVSGLTTGLKGLFSPEEAAREGLQREEEIGRKYEDQVSLDKIKQAYKDRGILSAAGEVVKQVPAAIAEQAPNLAVMAGGAAAGSVLGPVGAVAGAALPSLLQQYGGNIERQAHEGKRIEAGKAAAAAVPQAALDVAGTFIPFGGKIISKLTGIPEKAFFSKSAAQAEKIANERLLTTIAKGTATGALLEVPTEIAQQMLERAQAGLSLTSPDAMAEYGQTAYQVGLLGPLGAVGRFADKSGYRQDIEDQKAAEAALAAQAEAAAPAAQAAPEQAALPAPTPTPALGYTPEEQLKPAPRDLPTAISELTRPPVEKKEAPKTLQQLMDEHDTLQLKQDALYDKMGASPQAFKELGSTYKENQAALDALRSKIEAQGGTTETPERFETQAKASLATLDKKIENANKAFATAMDKDNRDLPAAEKATAQLDKLTAEREALLKSHTEKRAALAEKTASLTQRGQPRELFTAEEAPVPTAATKEEALSVAQPEAEQEEKAALDTKTLDIFSDANILRTAIQNKDEAAINRAAQAEDQRQREARNAKFDQEKAANDRLMKALDERLDLGGEGNLKRERVPLKDEANKKLLRSGSHPDKDLQKEWDEQGELAYDYNRVQEQVADLRKKVESKQGNAKMSVLQQLNEMAKQHEELIAQMESGIATPTMGERVENLKAKQGKAEPRAERQMDASERHNLQRKIDALVKRYNHLVDTRVKPVRAQIEKLHDSLYSTTVPEKASVLKARQDAENLRRAQEKTPTGRVPKSRAATTAARINSGNVRKEAEASEKMRNLAMEMGREDHRYVQMVKENQRRLKALKEKYGKDDKAVREFETNSFKELQAKALQFGKESPEYKATLKEQVAYFQEVLGQGKQVQASKRTTQETRRIGVSKEPYRTGTPESRAASEAANLRVKGSRMTKAEMDQIIREANENEGDIAYRAREAEGTTVDAKEAADFMEKVQSNLPENVKLVYAATPGKIPMRLLKMMQDGGVDPTVAMVQGAVFPDGTVLVVGDQHADLKDLEATVLHELVGHYGIDTLIGKERLQAYADKTDLRKLAEEIGGNKLLNEVQRVAASHAAMGHSEAVQKYQVLREIIAHTEEARVDEKFRERAGRWLKELVGMVRAALRGMGFTHSSSLSTSDIFYALKQSRKAFANKTIGTYRAADGQIAFRTREMPSNFGASFIADSKKTKDKLMGNFMGLTGRVQFVDQYAALSEAMKRGVDAKAISSLEAEQGEFYLRFGQQRSQFAGQALTNGPLELRKQVTDRGTEYTYASKKGANMVQVAEALEKGKFENDTEAEAILTAYVAGQRAEVVGWNKLNFNNPNLAKQEHAEIMRKLNASPEQKAAVEEAAKIYKEYNDGLVDFLEQTGAISAKLSKELKSKPFIPFYRVNSNNNNLELLVDKEHPIRIGNVKDEPQLKELVGGNTQIMPIFTSAVQNTFMLTDMGLRNQMVKNSAFTLHKLGIASVLGEGTGPKGPNTVRFKVKGEDHFATIDTDLYGVPAELIVKGMEGIKTTLPAVIKAMGVPANILRQFVTRNPVYAVRQVVRDPLNAWLTTGTDATPVLSSMKELASMVAGRSEAEAKLMEAGAISSNVFTGDQRDMDKFLKEVATGKSGWDKAMARLDAFAMQGDAATRAVVYKDSLDKGMSEMQALLRTLESMNFGRRGLSPSMQALSVMIPFFNAQIQGLDVLYRAFTGQMPYNEQLKVRQKLFARGLMVAAGTMAYAAMMQDDEAYKRAKPEERLGNWFVHIPGVEEPLRVPIPFELGYLFKALPEAVMNTAFGDEKVSQAAAGMGKLIGQTNPFGLPQAIKPLTEVVLGKSFFAGDIESKREQNVLATERYRDSSTEIAKMIGSVTGEAGLSPIKIDYLIRGYTGGLGIALVQLANPLLNTKVGPEVAEPSLKASKTPFIGGLFQPVEGRGTLDEAYDRMLEIQQTKGTFNRLVEKGDRADAMAFAQSHAEKLGAASVSGAVQRQLGDFATMRRKVIASPSMSTEQKDDALKRIDKAQTDMARRFLEITD